MLIHNRSYEKPFFLNVIENEQKMKRRQKPDENFTPFQNRRNIVQEIPLSELENEEYYRLETLESFTRGKIKIFTKDDKYFLYETQNDIVKYVDITEFIYAQLELLQIVGCWSLVFLILVYLISLLFVKNSLKNLKKLTAFAENLNFNDLSSRIQIPWAPNDEIKLIAEALNTSLEKIDHQVLSLKDFIWNASHELKTPLMMINTEIDLALKKKDYPERLSTIKNTTKRIASLLDHLSLITRLESSYRFEEKDLVLREVFSPLQKTLEMQYPWKKIQFQWDKTIKIKANENLLTIVIKNLLENACKYAGDNADIIFIQTSHSFSIKDTGKGIPFEEQEKIFERFRQSEKTERNATESHSFWLGLYLVKKIVELQKRKIKLISEEEKGSEFRIKF